MITPTPADRVERLEFAQQLLQRRGAYIAAAVMRLGRVTFTDSVATAAILAEGSKVQLFFNEHFLDGIDNFELAAVLIHEALHFVFKHQERVAQLQNASERFLFNLACEAVVNDLIVFCFKEFPLPCDPVTGPGLVGKSVHDCSAEQVLQILRQRGPGAGPVLRLSKEPALSLSKGPALSLSKEPALSLSKEPALSLSKGTLDDHELWIPEPPGASVAEGESIDGPWSAATSALIEQLLQNVGRKDPCYGSSPLGAKRTIPSAPRAVRTDLTRFLKQALGPALKEETFWARPEPRLRAVYPEVVLPSSEPLAEWRVLIALDTSGSVPRQLLATAREVALQKLPDTRVTIISFDTKSYPVERNLKVLKGGGGTRVQAVEEYAQEHFSTYPDLVVVLTDGYTPSPTPKHPERWVWLLPLWGSVKAIPAGSRREFFS